MEKIIKISNNKNTTHSFEIYKNGERINPRSQVTKDGIIYNISDSIKEDIYEIRMVNYCLKYLGKSIIYGIISLIALLAGAGDELKEVTPVSSILKFSSIGDVNIKCLPIGNSVAFEIKGVDEVLINNFILEERYYKRWIFTTIVPLELVFFGLLILFYNIFKISIISAIIFVIFIVIQIFVVMHFNKTRRYLIKE